MVAQSYRNLTSGGSTTDANSFATASITPRPGELLLASVTNSHGTAATLPTASGNSLTWVQIATITFGSFYRITMFRAQGAAPAAGAVTFAFSGVTQTGCRWSVDGFNLAINDSANNGAASVGNSQTGTASAAALTLTYPSTPARTSAGFAAFSNNGNTAMTPRSGWTEVVDAGHATPNIRIETQRRLVLNTETAAGTTTSITGGGIAVEVFLNLGTLPVIEGRWRRYVSGLVRR